MRTKVLHSLWEGDTLWKVAKTYLGEGMRADLIRRENKIEYGEEKRLQIGRVLVIPLMTDEDVRRYQELKKWDQETAAENAIDLSIELSLT